MLSSCCGRWSASDLAEVLLLLLLLLLTTLGLSLISVYPFVLMRLSLLNRAVANNQVQFIKFQTYRLWRAEGSEALPLEMLETQNCEWTSTSDK